MNNPLVSIIIPTYNRAHLIGETLDSVLAQTYTNWECIVVDDGSTDNTDEVVNSYVAKDPRFKYYHRPPEHLPGGNGARNYGFKMSQGEYVNWFDDDDVMLPDFIKKKIEVFSDQIKMVICSCFMTDEYLKNRQKIDYRIETNLFKDYVLWKLKILTPSVLFKRDFLKDLNFNEQIHRGQETEFFSRIFFDLNPNSFKILEKQLFLYRNHLENKTTINKTYNKKFKKSQTIIALENIKKGLLLKDFEIIKYYYKFLVYNFFQGIEFNHISNSKNILKFLLKHPIPKKKLNYYEIVIFGFLFLIFKQKSYTIKQKWLNYSVKYEM